MSTIRNLTAAALITLTTGCATGLNSAQESELASYRAKNLAVEEKTLGWLPASACFREEARSMVAPTVLAS